MHRGHEIYKPNPIEQSNIISRLFFLYLFPILKNIYQYDIKEQDLFQTLNQDKSSKLGTRLERIWYKEHRKHKKNSLLRSLIKMFGCRFLFYGLVKLADEIMLITVIPLCVHKIISYFELLDRRPNKKEIYFYSAGLILCLFTDSLLAISHFMGMQHLAMKIRVACSAFVYRKILKLSKKSLRQTTVGQLVNIVSNDTSKFDEAFQVIHFSWIGPILVAVGTYLLYLEIGYGAFYGIGYLVSFVPFQIWLAHKVSKVRWKTTFRTDQRVQLMSELLSGIQVVKFYCWEKPFSLLITNARSAEIKHIRHYSYILGIIYSFEVFIARTAVFLSILGYVLLGKIVTAEKVFAVAAIYNCLRPTITMMFSLSITSIAQIYVSIHRIQSILESDEFKRSRSLQFRKHYRNNPEVWLRNVRATWIDNSLEDTVKDISFRIDSKMLVAIIGPVGSGKSTILNLILKELPIKAGFVRVVGSISFAAQEPWLFNLSVRENILFGEEFNAIRYKEVIDVCALSRDIASFPFGDKTLVGERGKVLSGGQRARVSLARCVYKVADIYLLDDPLSAVDAHVAKHIYENCIKSFLSDKIRILVTHQLQFIKSADRIMIVDDGTILGFGTYQEIRSSSEDFAHFMKDFEIEEEFIKRPLSTTIHPDISLEEQLIDAEDLETGNISFCTYFLYFRFGGSWFVIIFIFLLFVLNQFSSNAGEYFLTYWVNKEQAYAENKTSAKEINRHLIVYQYSFITIGNIIVSLIKSIYFMIFLTIASQNLHNSMYKKLQYARMRFYDLNPSGRILNRFSRDLAVVDDLIPNILIDVLETSLSCIGLFLLSAIVQPYLLILDTVLVLIFYKIKVIFSETSRKIKKLEATTRSPLFGHITSSMYGLDTIRSFMAQRRLIEQFDRFQDVNSAAWFLYIASGQCLGLWLNLISQCFVGFAITIVILSEGGIQGGDMGLIITQYLALVSYIQLGIRQWTELDNNMVSVERLLEYTELETEPERIKFPYISPHWPEQGIIEFKNVYVKYDEDEAYILRNINFKIKAKEKVGLVGRTGAGKSSIIAALFQLYPIEGKIIIDYMDTTRLPFETFRSKISIIPQTPFLFSGTLRDNLDPFHNYNDDILWNALEQVDLKESLEELAGLNSFVSEGGSNFSVGERQLICMARALIKSNKILVLDEATASVDPQTDALIQKTIREKFQHCTILTVAHRLHTVMDADKIIVMDRGMLIEFDHPYILLKNKHGLLRELVDATGRTSAKQLELIAKERMQSYLTDDTQSNKSSS